MQQYNSMYDDTGNTVDSRICIFVKDADENGNFEQYQISKIITAEHAGLLFIINESDLNKLHNCKISYETGLPVLIEKENTEEETNAK